MSVADMNTVLDRYGLEERMLPDEGWYRRHAPHFKYLWHGLDSREERLLR